MTTIDAAPTPVTASQRSGAMRADPVSGPMPSCPQCRAPGAEQRVVRVVADGALELTVLECPRCGRDHPSWA